MSVGPTPLDIFRAKGVPHRRMEDWKYTDLRGALAADALETSQDLAVRVKTGDAVEYAVSKATDVPELFSRHIGRFDYSISSTMDAGARAFASTLHTVRVPAGVTGQTLEIEYAGEGQGHIVLLLEADSELTFVETHHSGATGLRNVSLSIVLLTNARLNHFREAHFAPDLVSVETASLIQEDNTLYQVRVLSGGARLSRAEFNVYLNAGAEADLSGISVLSDGAHADITTRIHHAEPNTVSRQLFKIVAGGKSRAVYQGKIIATEDGTDSRQTAKALLLSDRAEADLKPELEILADDVKCAHGAAVGDLDADSLFYLRARGIPEAEARGLLIHAFLQEVVDGIEDEGLRGAAVEFIDSGLAWAMESAS